MSNRIAHYQALAFLFFFLLSCSRTSPPIDDGYTEQRHFTATPPASTAVLGAEPEIVEATIVTRTGGELSLPDGATLHLPTDGLPVDSEVAIEKMQFHDFPPLDHSIDISVGAIYRIDVHTAALSKPIMVDIPFDPALMPEDSQTDHIFLSSYQEETGQWIYAAGQVDKERNMITRAITQTSYWSPRVWDWQAWTVFVNTVLEERIIDTISSTRAIDCTQVTDNIAVDSNTGNKLLQGCIGVDDPEFPEIQVVNLRSFFVELDTNPLVSSLSSSILLWPGDMYNFEVNTLAIDPPLKISADVTPRIVHHFLLDLILALLPGGNQPGEQPEPVSCLAETLNDIHYLNSAVEALANNDSLAAAEEIGWMLRDEDTMGRVLKAASDCSYGPATTWSLSGLSTLGNSASVIASTAEILGAFIANHPYSEAWFFWESRRAEIRNQTEAHLQEIMLLDSNQDTSGCYGIDQISYSPTLEHFMVIVGCFEGDNEAFLFRSDGSSKQQITGEWDYLNYDFFDWSPDGRYFVYQRINSCCADVPTNAPPTGLVRYDVASGEKKLLLTGAGKPKWSADGNWIAYLRIAYPAIHIDVVNTGALTAWRLDTLDYNDPWSILFVWEQTEIPEVLLLKVTQSGQERVYPVSVQSGDSAPGMPIPVPTLSVYRVVNVGHDDVLNVRSGPGVDNPIVGFIPPDGSDIQIIGDEVRVGNSRWVPIRYQDITGWVNKSFLVEQSSNDSDE
jgi:hypothetical protein